MRPFDLTEGQSPLILSFPHSGTDVPEDIAQNLNHEGKKLTDTDWHVSRLYEFAKTKDVTWLQARYSRYVIDLNRDPEGKSLYPGQNTTGLCPLEDFDGKPLWCEGKAPDVHEIKRRAQRYFNPYHEALAAQIIRVKTLHGYAVLYDCHSIRGTVPRLFSGDLPVLNLGTNQGRSCGPALQAGIANILQASPFTHVVNGRFRGGWITRHYAKPNDNVYAVQMEIAQRAYMEECPPWLWRAARAKRLQAVLNDVLEVIQAKAKHIS